MIVPKPERQSTLNILHMEGMESKNDSKGQRKCFVARHFK